MVTGKVLMKLSIDGKILVRPKGNPKTENNH